MTPMGLVALVGLVRGNGAALRSLSGSGGAPAAVGGVGAPTRLCPTSNPPHFVWKTFCFTGPLQPSQSSVTARILNFDLDF